MVTAKGKAFTQLKLGIIVPIGILVFSQSPSAQTLSPKFWQKQTNSKAFIGNLSESTSGTPDFKFEVQSLDRPKSFGGIHINQILADSQLNPGTFEGFAAQFPVQLTFEDGKLVQAKPKSMAVIHGEKYQVQTPSAEGFEGLLKTYETEYRDAIEASDLPKRTRARFSALAANEKLSAAFAEDSIHLFKQLEDESLPFWQRSRLQRNQEVMTALDEERFALEPKTAYGNRTISTYRATHFGAMLTNSLSVGRIQRRDNGSLVGSAVHVGDGYFLTAAHVVPADTAPELEITFRDVSGGAGVDAYTFIKEIDFESAPPGTAPKMDLVLCRIEATPETVKNIPRARPKSMLTTQIQALKAQTIVYVVGYPNLADFPGRSIHDDSYVLFPRWIKSSEIKSLFARLTYAELAQLCKSPTDALKKKVTDLSVAFRKIYGYSLGDALRVDGYFATLFGMQIIGLESDTSKGDSGGAVFQKDTGELVGIFCRGMLDSSIFPNGATVREFELAIPIETFWPFVAPKLSSL